MRLIPEDGIGACIQGSVYPQTHGSARFYGTGAGGGGALAGAQHLAGVRMEWHEGTESLAAEKPHHPPRIGPTSQPGLVGHAKQLGHRPRGEEHVVFAEGVHRVGAAVGDDVVQVTSKVTRPTVGKIGNACFDSGHDSPCCRFARRYSSTSLRTGYPTSLGHEMTMAARALANRNVL